jgi:uncharacterized small protein (DUF1192 family)
MATAAPGVRLDAQGSNLIFAHERGATMAIFDDEPKKKARPHEIGQDLSLLSVDELSERIGILRDEIARLEAELKTKSTTKSAAEALFRRE